MKVLSTNNRAEQTEPGHLGWRLAGARDQEPGNGNTSSVFVKYNHTLNSVNLCFSAWLFWEELI